MFLIAAEVGIHVPIVLVPFAVSLCFVPCRRAPHRTTGQTGSGEASASTLTPVPAAPAAGAGSPA